MSGENANQLDEQTCSNVGRNVSRQFLRSETYWVRTKRFIKFQLEFSAFFTNDNVLVEQNRRCHSRVNGK